MPKRQIIYISGIEKVKTTISKNAAGKSLVTLEIETERVNYMFDLNPAKSSELLSKLNPLTFDK